MADDAQYVLSYTIRTIITALGLDQHVETTFFNYLASPNIAVDAPPTRQFRLLTRADFEAAGLQLPQLSIIHYVAGKFR